MRVIPWYIVRAVIPKGCVAACIAARGACNAAGGRRGGVANAVLVVQLARERAHPSRPGVVSGERVCTTDTAWAYAARGLHLLAGVAQQCGGTSQK